MTRIKTPWLVRPVQWTPELAKRAVIWLSEKVGKAILRLETGDFFEHHLYDLVYSYNGVDDLLHQVFEDLRTRVYYRDQLPEELQGDLLQSAPGRRRDLYGRNAGQAGPQR